MFGMMPAYGSWTGACNPACAWPEIQAGCAVSRILGMRPFQLPTIQRGMLKEFYPELQRKLFNKKPKPQAGRMPVSR